MKPKRGLNRLQINFKTQKEQDAWRHWEKKGHYEQLEHEIIPEHIQHFRIDLIQAFRRQGQSEAERIYKEYASFFRDCAKEGRMSAEQAKGGIENLDGLMKALKKLRDKKRKERGKKRLQK